MLPSMTLPVASLVLPCLSYAVPCIGRLFGFTLRLSILLPKNDLTALLLSKRGLNAQKTLSDSEFCMAALSRLDVEKAFNGLLCSAQY